MIFPEATFPCNGAPRRRARRVQKHERTQDLHQPEAEADFENASRILASRLSIIIISPGLNLGPDRVLCQNSALLSRALFWL